MFPVRNLSFENKDNFIPYLLSFLWLWQEEDHGPFRNGLTRDVNFTAKITRFDHLPQLQEAQLPVTCEKTFSFLLCYPCCFAKDSYNSFQRKSSQSFCNKDCSGFPRICFAHLWLLFWFGSATGLTTHSSPSISMVYTLDVLEFNEIPTF